MKAALPLLLFACLSAVRAQGCCSTDLDCTSMLSPANLEYLTRYGKAVECDQECPGLMNCNMFGVCDLCRGCFETCEGAMLYMKETFAPAEFITFCSGVGVSDLSECDEGSASGAGSGSGSMSSSSASGSGDGSGSSASGSGNGSGSTSTGGGGSGANAGGLGGTAWVEGSAGSASGAGSGFGSLSSSSAFGSGNGSGSVSAGGSSSATGAGAGDEKVSGTADGSGGGSRIADIPGCDCGTAELEPAFAAFFCNNRKSLYCDNECVDGADPSYRLFPSMGGLWCQPQGWEGCRICKFDCSDYGSPDCVPCPPGVKNWC